MFRSLIDAAIVWYEGVPPDIDTNFKQWVQLSRQTGETFAQILKQFTGFTHQKTFATKEIVFNN